MDNENTNQDTAEVEARAAYIRSLVRPSVNGKQNGRKVWSIDLEAFWVPFFTATNTEGHTSLPAEALGAPLRLVKDSDGAVRFSKSGKPVIKVVKEIADGVKLVRENMVANGMAYIADVKRANPEGYKATVEAAEEAGAPIIERQNKDMEAAIERREEAEREEAEAAAARATAKAKRGGRVPATARHKIRTGHGL